MVRFFSAFKFYRVTPRMLALSSILFMRVFEVVCCGWGFAPFIGLLRAFFKILKANNRLLNFYGRTGLSIFTNHKYSIKY